MPRAQICNAHINVSKTGQTGQLWVEVRDPASICNQERHPMSSSGLHIHLHVPIHTTCNIHTPNHCCFSHIHYCLAPPIDFSRTTIHSILYFFLISPYSWVVEGINKCTDKPISHRFNPKLRCSSYDVRHSQTLKCLWDKALSMRNGIFLSPQVPVSLLRGWHIGWNCCTANSSNHKVWFGVYQHGSLIAFHGSAMSSTRLSCQICKMEQVSHWELWAE